jgi:hypothetical protein
MGGGTTTVICIGVVLIIAALMVIASRVGARRSREFAAFAASSGWTEPPSPLPEPLVTVARSYRSRLMLYSHRDGFDVWISWHRWTEISGGNPTRRSGSTTHDVTRYFVALGRRRPNAVVQRRTGLGGLLKPVRGHGTGDAEFDRAFVVRPTDEPVVLALLTPPMRAALRSGRVPPWQIADDLLITTYLRPPTAATLNAHADAAVQAALLLPA